MVNSLATAVNYTPVCKMHSPLLQNSRLIMAFVQSQGYHHLNKDEALVVYFLNLAFPLWFLRSGDL